MQGVTTIRSQLSNYTKVPAEKLIFEVGEVGGGFGQRSGAYPEYAALMIAAKALGAPVKWTGTRTEGFLTDTHGRNMIAHGQLALDKDGKFLAMRIDWIVDLGAYLSPGAQGHIRNTTNCMTGVYKIPALYATYRIPITNTTPIGAYRGAGRPDIAYAVERLVNQAAAEIGMDPAELRRRNFIPPNAFPVHVADRRQLRERRHAGRAREGARARRLERFRCAACEIESRPASFAASAYRPSSRTPVSATRPQDEVEIQLDASGTVTAAMVAKTQGHGHETTFGTIIANALQIPLEKVKLAQCPPGTKLKGNGTGGSRSTVGAGSVCHLAALKLVEEGKALAALELGVEPSQVAYANGEFTSDASDRVVKLADLAKEKPLTFMADGKFGSTYPNGCHIAEVEVDPETGVTEVVSYCAVDDIGVVINHAIVEGQLHGGVVQGAGQVFGEKVVYDPETGQPLTATFMDYYMPRAGLIPELRGEEHPTESKVSPLGVKGVGESGCTASIPVLVGAVLDAVRPLGIKNLDMPLTPARVWGAIRDVA